MAARRKKETSDNAKKVLNFLKQFEGFEIRVGLAPEEGSDAKFELKEGGAVMDLNYDINVATAAFNNEFGTALENGARVPSRPAFRQAARGRPIKRAIELFALELKYRFENSKKLTDKTVQDLATDLGGHMTQLLVEQLDSDIQPRNAPRTIRDKGFDKTLEATGQTMKAISAQIFMRRKRKLRVFANGTRKTG